jgi:hypothetical protein
MDVCCECCVVRLRSLRRADHSSREVLHVVRRVWSRNPKNDPRYRTVGRRRVPPWRWSQQVPRNVRTHPHQGRYIPGHVQFATAYPVRMLFWYLHQEKVGRGMQHEGRPMRKQTYKLGDLCVNGNISRTTSGTQRNDTCRTGMATGRLVLNGNEPPAFNSSWFKKKIPRTFVQD